MRPATAQDRELAARRHLAYRFVLKKCLRLADFHMKALQKHWNATAAQVRRLGFRSAPQSETQILFLNHYTERYIDLWGVAGFYVELEEGTGVPFWKFNAPSRNCILRPFRDASELIQGVLVYRHATDPNPFLLSSRGLWAGSKAVHYDPLIHH